MDDDSSVELPGEDIVNFIAAVDSELSRAQASRSLCVLSDADAAEDQLVVLALTEAHLKIMQELRLLFL